MNALDPGDFAYADEAEHADRTGAEEEAQWAGFNPEEPHRLRTSGTLVCSLCGRIASDRIHDVEGSL